MTDGITEAMRDTVVAPTARRWLVAISRPNSTRSCEVPAENWNDAIYAARFLLPFDDDVYSLSAQEVGG
jgi:hypothetical protein